MLTIARAIEAASITTSLSLVRFAFASSLSSAVLTKCLIHHKRSGAVQRTLPRRKRSLTLSQFLLASITFNAIPALTQACGGIAIVATGLAYKNDNTWMYSFIILVQNLISSIDFDAL